MSDITFKVLKFAGFGPFNTEQVVQLSGTTGIIFITGVNEVNPALEGNGVGKSTLFDALTFVCYGRTADNSRGQVLVNADHKDDGAFVTLELRRDGQAYTIERTIRPNSLTLHQRGLDSRTVEQHVIDELLGMKFPAWLATVHHAQDIGSFLDLGPTQQLDLLAELLDLDVYARAADVANNSAKDQGKEVSNISYKIAGSRGQLIVLEKQRDDIESREVEYLRKRYRFLRGVDREIASWRKQIVVTNNKLDDTLDRISKTDFEDDDIREYKEKASTAAHKLAKVVAESHLLRTRRDQLRRALRETLACPTCGRPFEDAKSAESHAKKELKSIDDELEGYKEEIARLHGINESATKRFLSSSKKQEDILDDLRTRRRDLETSVASAKANISQLEKKRHEMLEEPNPYIDEAEETDKSVEAIKDSLDRWKFKLDRAQAREADYQYWVKGFKDLRLSIVEAALLQLTLEVNNVLDRLGLPTWRLAVEAEGITKSGGVRRGLRIAVIIDGEERSLRFSFGERQRLRQAVCLGVADMIESITGVHFNIELFDEPTSWLSPAGVDALLTVLSDRATVRERRIFLADHRSHAWPFTQTMVITKTREGAVIE